MKYLRITTILILFLSAGCSEKRAEPLNISVTNLDEFITGLATALQNPGTTLTLSPGLYDVSGASIPDSTIGLSLNEDIPGRALGSGAALVINGAKDLTIRSADPDNPAEILSSNPYAKVLGFYQGNGIRLEYLVSGHSPDSASVCMGAVWAFSECKNISITNSDLFGCGTHGLQLFRVHGFDLLGGIIRECSQGGIKVILSSDVTIKNLTLLNNNIMKYARPTSTWNFALVHVEGSKNIRLAGCEFEGNRATTAIHVTEIARGWRDVVGADTPGTPLILKSCDFGNKSQYEVVTKDKEWVRFE